MAGCRSGAGQDGTPVTDSQPESRVRFRVTDTVAGPKLETQNQSYAGVLS